MTGGKAESFRWLPISGSASGWIGPWSPLLICVKDRSAALARAHGNWHFVVGQSTGLAFGHGGWPGFWRSIRLSALFVLRRARGARAQEEMGEKSEYAGEIDDFLQFTQLDWDQA